jgi:hypothetical protein
MHTQSNMKTTLLSLAGSLLSMMLYSQTITVGTITNAGSNWCPGDYVVVPYTLTGTFNPGNMFVLQMSDASLSFSSPQNIDTITGTSSGTFNSIIPMGTSYTGRTFRIISSNPAVISSTSNSIFVQMTPPINISTTGPFCMGQSFDLYADEYANWTGPNGLNATFTDHVTILNPTNADTGMYYVSFTNAHGCTNTDTIHITFSTPPTVNFSYPGNDTVCIGAGAQVLTGGTPPGGSYSGPGVVGNNFIPGSADTTAQNNIVYSYYYGSCWGADTVSITVLGCAGIEMVQEYDISVFPNPFTNSITIAGVEDKQAIVMNSIGEIIVNIKITETNRTIPLENLPNGIYFLRIDDRVQKLIKN